MTTTSWRSRSSNRNRGLIAAVLLLFAFIPAPGKTPPVPESSPVSTAAYGLMFDKELDKAKVEAVITECLNRGAGTRVNLPLYGSAIGILAVMEIDAPLSKVEATLTEPHKEKIFKSSLMEYEEEVDTAALKAFNSRPEGRYVYSSFQKVFGRLGTRFAYTARTELVKTSRWMLCRESLADKARLIRGIGGYLDVLNYFTILVDKGGGRTLRVSACWNDSGGKIPRVGRVRASHNDILANLKSSYRDILAYLDVKELKEKGSAE
jgi:hypothetical protein